VKFRRQNESYKMKLKFTKRKKKRAPYRDKKGILIGWYDDHSMIRLTKTSYQCDCDITFVDTGSIPQCPGCGHYDYRDIHDVVANANRS